MEVGQYMFILPKENVESKIGYVLQRDNGMRSSTGITLFVTVHNIRTFYSIRFSYYCYLKKLLRTFYGCFFHVKFIGHTFPQTFTPKYFVITDL
jgi:hypothetical protein